MIANSSGEEEEDWPHFGACLIFFSFATKNMNRCVCQLKCLDSPFFVRTVHPVSEVTGTYIVGVWPSVLHPSAGSNEQSSRPSGTSFQTPQRFRVFVSYADLSRHLMDKYSGPETLGWKLPGGKSLFVFPIPNFMLSHFHRTISMIEHTVNPQGDFVFTSCVPPDTNSARYLIT